nr:MAG TPA: tail protein [Caudoviricetes sp.]
MYAGYVNGRLLFAAGMDGYEISAGTIHRADGECDSADFKLPASNIMRDVPVKRASVISIRRDGKEVFRGSVADTSTDLRGGRAYSVDGAMLWLADIRKPPFTMTEDTMTYYVTALLTQYNAACLPAKQIQLGTIDTTLPRLAVEQTEYKTILALLQEGAQAVGGTLRIRYEDGGIYLDVLKAYNHRCAQQVDIRKNLLDLTDKIDGADLITRVYPIGKDGLTIASVNDGATYLANATAEALYGRIDGTLRVDTDDAAALKAAAATYLAQNCGLSRGIQVSAADLSGTDITLEPYHIGDNVRVVSPPHGIDTIMTVSKLDTSLVGDKDTMTLGWSSRTLTAAVASGGGGSSGGTTTSGGGGTIDVDSALSTTSTNPVQNKVVTAALASKASTAAATQSAAGLMSAADKAKLDGMPDKVTTLTAMTADEMQALWDAN